MSSLDLFLQWLSERAGGSWATFSSAHSWLLSEELGGTSAWITGELLSDLGHIDINWQTRRWSIAPPVANYLPPRSMLAVLCGARTGAVEAKLEHLRSGPDGPDVEIEPFDQAGGPTVWLILGERAQTKQLAGLIGAQFVDDAASSMAELLPSVVSQLGRRSAVRGGARSLRRFDAGRLDFVLVREMDAPGLYRLEGTTGTHFVYAPERGLYHDVDRGVGVYVELARTRTEVLSYQAGSFWVPRMTRLPAAQRRCLTLCSGFLPTDEDDYVRYRDVPRPIASRVASSLSQKLTEGPPRAGAGGGRRP